jgi:predicted dienelactone hydrolase
MTRQPLRLSNVFIFLLLAFAGAGGARGNGYDPLAVDPKFHAQTLDLSVHDAARNRDIPVRIYLPVNGKPEPVVLFSHGLGGSRAGGEYLGEQWAARGYAATASRVIRIITA